MLVLHELDHKVRLLCKLASFDDATESTDDAVGAEAFGGRVADLLEPNCRSLGEAVPAGRVVSIAEKEIKEMKKKIINTKCV